MVAEGELLVAHIRRKDARGSPPTVLGFQPAALVDHVARVDWSLLDRIPGDRGGSQQVAIEELNHILGEVNAHILPCINGFSPIRTIAGGSVANTIRGLTAGFGVSSGIIGACGDDEQGCLFIHNMKFSAVDLSRLRMKKGPTGQANELAREDFKGSKWLVLRYAFFNLEPIKTAIKLAKQEGLSVSLDLASFEMVRDSRPHLIELLETGNIDLCFANEDEARELIRGDLQSDSEAALNFLANHCKWAVVTLGPRGCIAKHGKEIVRVAATGEAPAVDATGAGDLFASGFLYGLVKDLPLEECCKLGSCSGGSVVRSLGGEVRPENWQWMREQMQNKGLSLPNFSE
ncbi:2-dehydro-3-deoxygluconokinase protein [Dioscorea alata]|uniref:2-dehydro-3-deoxygluconokinase protein n=1 Tax=Dioscorea alata TaxID=55571 RepID=A0ACB7W5Q1_DIOAL|nr:2-dehydro-3-deoxygluconokinase protein [Dioscorea alata]